MPNHGTMAVVVTYFPDADVVSNLAALMAQVEHVIVVDNGSPAASLEALRRVAVSPAVTLLENGANLGIATALNRGVELARSRGAEYILLFDQDSTVTEGFTDTLLHAFRTSPWGERLGILVPLYRDKRLGTPLPANTVRSGGLEAAMTSGSLLRASTFAQHGVFRDELFIDAVDYEYSLRLRRAGLVIDECPEAVLLHSPGEPVVHRLRGPETVPNGQLQSRPPLLPGAEQDFRCEALLLPLSGFLSQAVFLLDQGLHKNPRSRTGQSSQGALLPARRSGWNPRAHGQAGLGCIDILPFALSNRTIVILSGGAHGLIVSAEVEGPAFLPGAADALRANRRSFDSIWRKSTPNSAQDDNDRNMSIHPRVNPRPYGQAGLALAGCVFFRYHQVCVSTQCASGEDRLRRVWPETEVAWYILAISFPSLGKVAVLVALAGRCRSSDPPRRAAALPCKRQQC